MCDPNEAGRIWANLKYILIISVLSRDDKRYALALTRITGNISVC